MVQYDIVIHANGSGPDGEAEWDRELRSFAKWLRDDEAIRTAALIKLRQGTPQPGAMGTAFDVIQLTVESGFQLANLALAYVAWRATRTRPSAVAIEHNGVRVELNTSDPEEVTRLLARLREER